MLRQSQAPAAGHACSELVLVLVEGRRVLLEALALANVEHDCVGLVASSKGILLRRHRQAFSVNLKGNITILKASRCNY